MSLPTLADIEYPESDGQPMGETDLHRLWMIRLYELLRWRYADQQVYIGSDLLVYYEEGKPQRFCVPDVFVVLDCPSGHRRVFKTWAEGRVPDVVIEVTSLSSRREDEVFKPKTYSRIGVKEYFLFDPTNDYLSPALIGFRLSGDETQRILPDASGSLHCATLGVRLWLEGDELVLADAATGQRLLTEAEA
ncbi:MAG TPA: Uma2 family endonuclease, partial [Pirellulaceae bacterium]|nr:Uma2 family endonuclease [Pirellulaceae bacterium]